MNIIGIDPGVNGGIVGIEGDYDNIIYGKMPGTMLGVYDMLSQYRGHCYLEHVWGRKGNNAKSNTKFMTDFGAVQMALTVLKKNITLVTPKKWQTFVGVFPIKNEKPTAHKNRLKARAQELFPQIKMTLWLADALLIAYYGKCLETGKGGNK